MRSKQLISRAFVLAALAAVLVFVSASSALASSGGVGPGGGSASASSKPRKAHTSHGKAYAPSNAPSRIRKAIAAGNRIRHKPYKWGGGHGHWNDRGYDCSGTVSYILHAAGLLKTPRASGSLRRWGHRKGRGRWITVYANGGHAYIVVAGLRMDTSGTGGKGPRWQSDRKREPNGPFSVRHYNSKY